MALAARAAGYAHRVLGNPDDERAFEAWLAAQTDRDTSIFTLAIMWDIGMADYNPHAINPDGHTWVTVSMAAVMKDVTPATIYTILNDEARRNKIFPRARRDAQGWVLHVDDVTAYRPVRGRGRKAARQRLDVELDSTS